MSSSEKAPKKKDKKPSEKPAKAKPTKLGAGKPKLGQAQRAALQALPAIFDEGIDRNVAEIQQEARDLEATLGKLGKEIYAKSTLSKEVGQSLEARRSALEIAEAAWTEHRNASLSKSLRAVRAEAEELKRDAIAAIRHFCEEDSSALARVEAIVLGTGLADLIDDLKKLAALLDENQKELTRADLPKHAADRARGLAESLSRGSADRAVDPVGAAAMSLRNRAFWWLREAMDAVRSAGRYVYRKQPKRLVSFRASSTRARARAGTVRSVDKAPPAAVNGAPSQT